MLSPSNQLDTLSSRPCRTTASVRASKRAHKRTLEWIRKWPISDGVSTLSPSSCSLRHRNGGAGMFKPFSCRGSDIWIRYLAYIAEIQRHEDMTVTAAAVTATTKKWLTRHITPDHTILPRTPIIPCSLPRAFVPRRGVRPYSSHATPDPLLSSRFASPYPKVCLRGPSKPPLRQPPAPP